MYIYAISISQPGLTNPQSQSKQRYNEVPIDQVTFLKIDKIKIVIRKKFFLRLLQKIS